MAQSTSAHPAMHETEGLTTTPMGYPSLAFTLPPTVPKFGPRVGRLTLTRHDGTGDRPGTEPDADTKHTHDATTSIMLDTPNILVSTSRGVVPHFSRDQTNTADAIRWLNIPFESFLEQAPPVPTLQRGPHPLHHFLGFDEGRQITSLCLRNPLDTREMPPNGNAYVCANCVRGVKKVTLSDWRRYVYQMRPDVVFALTDTPFTQPPLSQKRITKSIERSAEWLADILRPLATDAAGSSGPHMPQPSRHPLNVFCRMAGGMSLPAREAFAYALRETLHGPEAEAIKPFRCLDDGVSGYAFDLAVLRGVPPSPNSSQHQTLPDGFLDLEDSHMLQRNGPIMEVPTPSLADEIGLVAPKVLAMRASRTDPQNLTLLFKASLEALSEAKPRLVTGIRSPHEMLRLVRDIGADLFDVGWAINAANLGVSLDFVFPVLEGADARSRQRVGHNLYDPVYARQFGRLADSLVGAGESADEATTREHVCACIACSPRASSAHILHSTVDPQSYPAANREAKARYGKPYSRAYVHHLLHTHEMSAHTFLVAHNLAVVSAFLAGVRRVCEESGDLKFAFEVGRFSNVYEESGELLVAAKKDWEAVDKARGKGRLAKEREKQENGGVDEGI